MSTFKVDECHELWGHKTAIGLATFEEAVAVAQKEWLEAQIARGGVWAEDPELLVFDLIEVSTRIALKNFERDELRHWNSQPLFWEGSRDDDSHFCITEMKD